MIFAAMFGEYIKPETFHFGPLILSQLIVFLFALCLFWLQERLKARGEKKVIRKHLLRELQYNETKIKDWIDMVDIIERRISTKNRNIFDFFKYTQEFMAHFLNEAFKKGMLLENLSDEDTNALLAMILHFTGAHEQVLNEYLNRWRTPIKQSNGDVIYQISEPKEIQDHFIDEKKTLEKYQTLIGKLRKTI